MLSGGTLQLQFLKLTVTVVLGRRWRLRSFQNIRFDFTGIQSTLFQSIFARKEK